MAKLPMIYRGYYVVLGLTLLSCSQGRIEVRTTDDFSFASVESVRVTGLRIHPTYRGTSELASQQSEVVNAAITKLELRGYKCQDQNPDYQVTFSLSASENAFTSDEELRFMKGLRGSHFPVADPRTRSYQSDSLNMHMSRHTLKKPVYQATCRISSIEIAPSGNSKTSRDTQITPSEVIECLNILVDALPVKTGPID